MLFRRKTPPQTVTITNDAFRRWLRAHRPPWVWFLGLSELEQEQLAMLGDEHSQEVILAIGHAVADPGMAEAGVQASKGNASGEETLVVRIAESFARAIAARAPSSARVAPAAPPPVSMAGIGARRAGANGQAKRGLGVPAGDPT